MNSSIRYSRQVTLAGWGQIGQDRLAGSRVLIVGVGGLGVPAATYLATAGTGHLVLNDFDTVDESNLARQPLYTEQDIGKLKVAVASAALSRLNSEIRITCLDERLNADELQKTVRESDLVLDASDNFATRFAINHACVLTGTPLVSGAAIRFEAQLAVFRADLDLGPCYRCLYDESGDELEDCRGQGVASPLVGIIGSAMALEAVRLIIRLGEPLHSQLLVYDGNGFNWRTLRVNRDPGCPVCGVR